MLSPEQFKAVILGKGWTYRALAGHWGFSPVWISNIARNAARPRHWDDAVIGLPYFNTLRRSEKRRQQQADAYLATEGNTRKPTGAYRHHGHIITGSILAVFEDFGTLAEAGMRGIVFQVRNSKSGEEYGVLFETGLWEWLSADIVDQYLADTGLVVDDARVTGYQFISDAHLREDFKMGMFQFYA